MYLHMGTHMHARTQTCTHTEALVEWKDTEETIYSVFCISEELGG